jgi:hypothetical protein
MNGEYKELIEFIAMDFWNLFKYRWSKFYWKRGEIARLDSNDDFFAYVEIEEIIFNLENKREAIVSILNPKMSHIKFHVSVEDLYKLDKNLQKTLEVLER